MKDEKAIIKEAEKDVDPRVDLAVERTMLAMERTQLAWVRTVLTMITAGIAIDKLHMARIMAGIAWQKDAYIAGLVLTSTATALMAFVTVLFILRMRVLKSMRTSSYNLPQPGTLISIFIVAVGILAIFSLLYSW